MEAREQSKVLNDRHCSPRKKEPEACWLERGVGVTLGRPMSHPTAKGRGKGCVLQNAEWQVWQKWNLVNGNGHRSSINSAKASAQREPWYSFRQTAGQKPLRGERKTTD